MTMTQGPDGTSREPLPDADIDPVPPKSRLPTGQFLADGVTRAMGSWRFIIIQSCLLVIWVALNALGWIGRWDPYPFILLNLALSFEAAYAAPIIMMSQNRQLVKDRLNAEYDFQVDTRAEFEVAAIQQQLDELAGRQWQGLVELQHRQIEMLERIELLTRELHRFSPVEQSVALAIAPSPHRPTIRSSIANRPFPCKIVAIL